MRKLSMLSVAHLAIAAQELSVAAETKTIFKSTAVGKTEGLPLKDPDGYYDEINFRNLTYRFDRPKQNWQGQGKRKKPRVR